MPARIRPMEERDVDLVNDVARVAFDDLDDRVGPYPESPPLSPAAARIRIARLLETDPGGAWVAERDGALCGVALAIVREGIWGLSLLVVRPEAQSEGIGRELLVRARAHGDGARGFIILASLDRRALRSYTRLGLDLHPAMAGVGRPRGVAAPEGVRPWRPEDHEWVDDLDRAVRGAAHGGDIDALTATGATATVVPGRGYVIGRDGDVKLLAAADEDAARTLLRAHLAASPDHAVVEYLTSAQQWAVRECLDAGLELQPIGAVLTGGELGPMWPYLPSGAYL